MKLSHREHQLAVRRQANERAAESWAGVKDSVLADPTLDLETFKSEPRYKNKGCRLHLEKLKVLLNTLEVGRTYRREDIITLLNEAGYQVERVGGLLFGAFEVDYSERYSTYHILNTKL